MSNARNLANLLGTKTKVKDVDVDGTELVLDADGDSSITSDTDDQIDIKIGGTDNTFIIGSGVGAGIVPTTAYGKVVQIHDTGTSGANLRLTDSTSSAGTGNGFEIIQIGVNNYMINRETGFISLYTSGTERVKIDSNGHLILKKNLALDMTTSEGIDFGAAGSSANTLDDYEEGTWTPAINSGGSTLGIIADSAIYTKIGRFVHVQVYAISLASTTSSGFRISGLPFTNLSSGQTVGSIMFQNIDIPGSRTQMVAYAPSSSDIIRLYGVGDNISWQEITGTNTGTSFNMIINLQYTTS